MIDKAVFANEMGLLAGTYRYDADTPVLQAYYAALSPRLTTEEFQRGVRSTLDTERFWPSPAVLLEKAGADVMSRGEEAFECVRRVLSAHGGYRFVVADDVTFDAPTWAAISDCGGLGKMAEANEKRFVRAYAKALPPHPALPTGPRDLALPRGDR